jgi:hypothetical protein
VCNDSARIVDRRSQNRAAKLLLEVVNIKGQRGAAKILKMNPGTVHHIISNTPQAWKHVTLDRLMLAKIELAAEYVKHDADLSDDLKARIDHVMELDAELTTALRALKHEMRKL